MPLGRIVEMPRMEVRFEVSLGSRESSNEDRNHCRHSGEVGLQWRVQKGAEGNRRLKGIEV